MSNNTTRLTWLLLLAPLAALFAQSEGSGGTTGAEFLLSPPATRLDAMGGVLDGLGSDLEGVLVNPAVLAGIQNLGLQVHFVPLPNEVTHTQATVGIPMLGGLGVVSGQLFNAGTFTFVNELAQPVQTVSVFDVAAGVGFSRYLWRSVSLGANVKAIFRSLGDVSAFAVAADLGAAARFETPHIGQAPKPPTLAQLERQFQREQAGIDKQRQKKTADATAASAALKNEITDVTVQIKALDDRLVASGAPAAPQAVKTQDQQGAEAPATSAEEPVEPAAESTPDDSGSTAAEATTEETAAETAAETSTEPAAGSTTESTTPAAPASTQQPAAPVAPTAADTGAPKDPRIADMESRKAEAQRRLAALKLSLADAEAKEATSLADIDAWYAAETAATRARFEVKVADLQWIELERARLFEVIRNAEKELTQADVDANVDDIIAKTRAYVEDRSSALWAAESSVTERDQARIAALGADIEGYQQQIDDEVGPASARLRTEIDELRVKKAEVDASQTEQNKDQVKQQATQLQAQIVVKERELEATESDPWVKRLRDRIAGKEREIAELKSGITLRAEQTKKSIGSVEASAQADVQSFEDLRQSLLRELQKAKLKRELGTLEASNDRSRQKAQQDYKAKEESLYSQLLSAMYRHEERIFQSRLASVTQDAMIRRSAVTVELTKARDTLDDNLAFQQRYLGKQIAEEERKLKDAQAAGGSADDSQTKAVRADLAQKEADYVAARKEIEARQATFDTEEREQTSAESATIRYERQKVRLVYLQREGPYLNTSLAVSMRNLGSTVRFGTERYPMPTMVSASLGYAILALEDHKLVLSSQLDLPFHDTLSVGIGAEYSFADAIFVRFGYAFGNTERTFSAGIGLKLALGFTQYVVDYAFRPLPDYGFVHSVGVSIHF